MATPGGLVSEPVARYIGASRAENTVRAYAFDWARFTQWCARQTPVVDSLPAAPEVVAEYLAEHADQVGEDGQPAFAPATLSRWVAAINARHRESGLLPPGEHEGVARVLSGVRRARRTRQRKAKAITLARLARVLDATPITGFPAGVIGCRDAALLLAGFAGAFRPDELVNVLVGDLAAAPPTGVTVFVASSKTDQEAEGRFKALPFGADYRTCPPCAITRWRWLLRAWHGTPDTSLPAGGPAPDSPERARMMRVFARSTPGVHVCGHEFAPVPGEQGWALFPPITKGARLGEGPLSPDSVGPILRRRMAAAGLDATGYSGHSLRAGFVTEALTAGATVHEVMRQTWHRKPETVEGYARENAPHINNAVTKLGL